MKRLAKITFVALVLLVALPTVAPAPQFTAGVLKQRIVFSALASSDGAEVWDGSQLMLLEPDGHVRLFSEGFHSAADAEVSFDGTRILFAAKREAKDRWQIYEKALEDGAIGQLTSLDEDCRHPAYQSRFFTLDAPTPWDQVSFVANGQIHTLPLGNAPGSPNPGPVTFLPGVAAEPVVAPDGRVLFSYSDRKGMPARLFAINLDGTDVALLNGEASRSMRMAAVDAGHRLVFIESTPGERMGAGSLATLNLLRPQRSYQQTSIGGSLSFHSPSILPDGSVMVAAREGDRFALFRLDESITSAKRIHADPARDLVQPKAVAPRALPDGRGSVVDPSVDWALLYCLNVYTNGASSAESLAQGSVRRVRVLENPSLGGTTLGEAPVEADGSFHLRVPANLPLRLELLGDRNQVLRQGAWIYARNKEARGCIGCHEDPELTPANREPLALRKPAVDLTHAAGHAVNTGGAP